MSAQLIPALRHSTHIVPIEAPCIPAARTVSRIAANVDPHAATPAPQRRLGLAFVGGSALLLLGALGIEQIAHCGQVRSERRAPVIFE